MTTGFVQISEFLLCNNSGASKVTSVSMALFTAFMTIEKIKHIDTGTTIRV